MCMEIGIFVKMAEASVQKGKIGLIKLMINHKLANMPLHYD